MLLRWGAYYESNSGLGATSSLIEKTCIERLNPPIKTQRLPDIELANGQFERCYGIQGLILAEVEGVGARISARCVNARGAYDMLLGQDWLKATDSSAQFGTKIDTLSKKVRVRQRGRQLEVLGPVESSTEEEDDSDSGSSTQAERDAAESLDEILAQYGVEFDDDYFEDDCASFVRSARVLPPKIMEDTDESWVDEINIGPELPKKISDEVRSLCLEFKDCFARSFLHLEHTLVTTFKIQLKPGTTPMSCGCPRRFALLELRFMKEELELLEGAGVINRCEHDTEWLSGVTFPPQKYGNLRFCCTYVALNSRTIPKKYPLTRIDDLFEELAGYPWYTPWPMAFRDSMRSVWTRPLGYSQRF